MGRATGRPVVGAERESMEQLQGGLQGDGRRHEWSGALGECGLQVADRCSLLTFDLVVVACSMTGSSFATITV